MVVKSFPSNMENVMNQVCSLTEYDVAVTNTNTKVKQDHEKVGEISRTLVYKFSSNESIGVLISVGRSNNEIMSTE